MKEFVARWLRIVIACQRSEGVRKDRAIGACSAILDNGVDYENTVLKEQEKW